MKRTVLALALIACAPSAQSAISLRISPSYDNLRYSEWPHGDKPNPGASCSTWTCVSIGESAGEIDEVSSTALDLSASGGTASNDFFDYDFAYKSFASGDVEVKGIIPDQTNWSGYLGENFVGFGIKLQEGLDPPTYYCHLWFVNQNDTPRFKCGIPPAGTSLLGSAATALPENSAITFKDSTNQWCGWHSNDGSTWSALGCVTYNPTGTLYGGVFGTPTEPAQTTFASLTGVSASATITVIPGALPTFAAGPTIGTISADQIPSTFTLDQTGTVCGVACPDGQTFPTVAQVKAEDCTGNVAAVSSFCTVVAGGSSTSGNFNGLGATTTYDLHYHGRSASGDQAAITTIANQTTTTGGPVGTGTCIAPIAALSNAVINSGAGPGRTANVSNANRCRDGDDIVAGWDFSMPAETPIAAYGGIFNINSGRTSYFKGHHLYQCNLDWIDLEPTNNSYDWSDWTQCKTNMTNGGYEGIMLNVRGAVGEIRNCVTGAPMRESGWTSPTWVKNITTLIGTGCQNPTAAPADQFEVWNIRLDNATIIAHYVDFIEEFVAQGFHDDVANMVHIMHFASGSLGEECCGSISDQSISGPLGQIIAAWGTLPAAQRKKLAYMKEDPIPIINDVIARGMGNRGGIIENWLRHQYTPGNSAYTGQVRDANGYLTINPNFAIINELRHWADQMEFPNQTPTNYIAAGLRTLQMRRMVSWNTNDGMAKNGPLDDWMSTQVGHTAATGPQAFAWLMETHTWFNSAPQVINNLEVHLFQRETLGATTPTNNILHNKNNAGGALPESYWDARWSRDENNASNIIGFALEDSFWATSLTRDAVVKVTHFCPTAGLTVEVRNSAGTMRDSFDTVDGGGATDVCTATMFIDDFTAPASGMNKDFELYFPDGPVGVIFVRVIKNGGSCGAVQCATW